MYASQDTITFCKSDYIRLTDGEFLNDNVIDLQIKRSVLRTAVERSPGQDKKEEQIRDHNDKIDQECAMGKQFVTETKEETDTKEILINTSAPHNTSPVYAFSCMFYTKLTESCRGGHVTKNVSFHDLWIFSFVYHCDNV